MLKVKGWLSRLGRNENEGLGGRRSRFVKEGVINPKVRNSLCVVVIAPLLVESSPLKPFPRLPAWTPNALAVQENEYVSWINTILL
jgi:hypothetical protein